VPVIRDPIASYWAERGYRRAGNDQAAGALARTARQLPSAGVFPHRAETEARLRDALALDAKDGKAALYLGHLLFHLGRHAEGRAMWKKAAELGAEPVIAYRALGMAALTLDNDTETAAKYLTQANEADRTDAIVARDLAKVLFTQADKANSAERKKELLARARDTLKAAFPQGKGRSDFVSLLGRAQNRLGEYAATARMLDQVRVTVWEGSREVHDLFEDAHLALGEAQLKAGRAADALTELNRALEYPENLATGKLENDRQAHIHYLRGNALAALGQTQAALEAWKTAANEAPSKDEQKEAARKKAQEALTKASAPR
jgi:tetratricopeptide (TPR) repeat protein